MEQLLHQLIEYAVICDDAGDVTYANPALLRALGYESKSQPLPSLVNETERASFRQAIVDTMSGPLPSAVFHASLQTKRNGPVPFDGQVASRVGKHTVVLFNGQNQFSQAGKELESVLEAFPGLMMIFDRELRYRRIFTSNRKLLLDAPEYLLGKCIRDVMSSEDAKVGIEQITKVIESGNATEGTHRLTVDGNLNWFSVRVVPIRHEGEDCALWISRDVTDAVLARRRRAASHDVLQELLHIQERERQLLACELHDGFVQDVVGARMWLESVEHEWNGASETAKEALGVVRKSIDQAITQSRELINGLRPVLTDHSGMEAGLRAMIDSYDRQSETRIMFVASGNLGPLFPLLESAVMRIVQEALKNVVRHSKAKLATVEVSTDGENVQLVIEDDGIGYDLDHEPTEAFGVESIVRRANVFGGKAHTETVSGQGTKITVTLPAFALGEDNNMVTEQFSAMMLDRAESGANNFDE